MASCRRDVDTVPRPLCVMNVVREEASLGLGGKDTRTTCVFGLSDPSKTLGLKEVV